MAFVSIQYLLKKDSAKSKAAVSVSDLKQFHNTSQIHEIFVLKSAANIQLFLFSEHAFESVEHISGQFKEIFGFSIGSAPIIMHENEAVADFLKKANGVSDSDNHVNLLKLFAECFNLAREARTVGPVLQRLFQRSIWMHEKIRMNTGFYKVAVSYAGVFCELAQKIYDSLKGLVVHIYGESNFNSEFINELHRFGVRRFYFSGDSEALRLLNNRVNPTVTVSEASSFSQETDILVINNSFKEIITEDLFAARMALKNNAPLLVLCELTLPGKAALAKKFYNIFWYNLEDLEHLVGKNRSARKKLFQEIEPWIAQEVRSFYSWLTGDSRYRFMQIIGRSPKMQEIFELISRISQTDITALIQGESGTGKELVARAIHKLSNRSEKPFIAVNCGAIPDNLLESELFGYVRGAFTGAVNHKSGIFFEANHGTIFLDEIGELPQHLQVKILRFLQEGDIKPVGSNETINVDVRVIAASNRNLKEMVDQDAFRSDLYYRLNVILLDLPPLRKRKEDIPILAEHFLVKYANRFKKDVHEFSPEAMQLLQTYDWPGNVRELENAVEHAVALSLGKHILQYELPSITRYKPKSYVMVESKESSSLKDVEKNHILKILDATDWDYEKACDILGIGRTTLWRKLKEYDVKQP
ncbi:MAG: sigma 54-interacting transcriptional regulator [Calditrichae bacterium]|nr:sigma 54-interacting transcriptional regulator [Calditrichia bacterium]